MTFGCSVCGISSIGGTSGWTLVMAFLGMGDLGSDFLGVTNKQGATKNKHTKQAKQRNIDSPNTGWENQHTCAQQTKASWVAKTNLRPRRIRQQ